MTEQTIAMIASQSDIRLGGVGDKAVVAPFL
jgi:hypothetical protein